MHYQKYLMNLKEQENIKEYNDEFPEKILNSPHSTTPTRIHEKLEQTNYFSQHKASATAKKHIVSNSSILLRK
jgi:hypothetical protein